MGYNAHAHFEHMAQPQFFQNRTYTRTNLDVQDSWSQNIDPALQGPHAHSWHEHDQPLERWAAEPEKTLFTANSIAGFQFQDFSNHIGPTAPFPQAVAARNNSPPLSHDLSSTCSSVRSPRVEQEYYSDYYSQPQEECTYFPGADYLSQGLPDWTEKPQFQNFPSPSGLPCVNMSQVQQIADIQCEMTDEGYMGMETKGDFTEVLPQSMDGDTIHVYRRTSDEGLGASIKGENSPKYEESDDSHDNADVDAEGDEIEGDTIMYEAEEASDTDYNPRPARPRKRRTSTKSDNSILRRPQTSRITKKSKGSALLTCKSCPKLPAFPDASSLRQHVAVSHSRFFVCVFSFAGCKSTFASKNEWKRHVSSQHLNLCYWTCTQDNCSGAEFNRKDLYTQHLRRMHAPFAVKRQGKKLPSWEERVRELQTSALRERRSPPSRLTCTKEGCGVCFEGATAWDDRMEHVGKHLEKGVTIDQGADQLLVHWAQETKVIEPKGSGWRFCSGTHRRDANDTVSSQGDDTDEDDAECEDE